MKYASASEIKEMFAAVDEAARKPDDGWEANDRNPVPTPAVLFAKRLVCNVAEKPSLVGWDAMGGVVFEWGDGGDMVEALVIEKKTLISRVVNSDDRCTLVVDHGDAAIAVRAALAAQNRGE